MVVAGPVEALAGDRQALLALGGRLSGEQWAARSSCAGWSLQDVVSHLSALFWLLVDPSMLPDAGGRDSESAQEFYVRHRRGASSGPTSKSRSGISGRTRPIWCLARSASTTTPTSEPTSSDPGARSPTSRRPPTPSGSSRCSGGSRLRCPSRTVRSSSPSTGRSWSGLPARHPGPSTWGRRGVPSSMSCEPLAFVRAVTGRGTWSTAAPEGADAAEALGRLGQLHVC